MATSPRWSARAGLAALCVIGLALRMHGLGYGLPNIYNPDEVAIMNRALAFATGDLNPHNFLYPTLYFYVLFAWEGLAFVLGLVSGQFSSTADFERQFFIDPTFHFLAGRALSAMCGTLTILAVYVLGARLFDRATGLVGAAFLAVAPIAVQDAHYVKHDVPVTLLITLAYLAFARLIANGGAATTTAWGIAGALTGLAVSTHYYAVFLVLPLTLAAWLRERRGPRDARLRPLLVAGAAASVAFFAASPFLLVEPHTAWRDVVANRQIVMDRAVGSSGWFPSIPRYLALLATDALGWPVFAAAVVGIVVALVTRTRRALVLISFPMAFLLFISNTVPATRYLNPVLPVLALFAGFAVVRAGARAPHARIAITTGLAIVLAIPALSASWFIGSFFRQADTRTLAREFIETTVPDGASILVQPYSVALRQSREGLVEALRRHVGSEARASTKFQRLLALDPYPRPAYRTIFLGDGGLDVDKIYVSPGELQGPDPLAPLRAAGVEFVVLKRYDDTPAATLGAALQRNGRLLATFSPFAAGQSAGTVEPFLHNTDTRIDRRLERPGPVIDVWRVR